MRRLLSLAVFGALTLANAGCLLNIYSSDPEVRMEQLLFNSEDLRTIHDEWRRIWFTDMPSHLSPQRVHGGIGY